MSWGCGGERLGEANKGPGATSVIEPTEGGTPGSPSAGPSPDNTPDAGDTGRPSVSPPVPPTQYLSVTVSGELQSVISGEGRCDVLTTRPGYYDVENGVSVPPTDYLQSVLDDGTIEGVLELPESVQRDYGAPIRLASGNVAFPYQSTPGWQGQNGTHHGVLVVNQSSGKMVDHDLTLVNLERPTTLIERGGAIMVVAGEQGGITPVGGFVEFGDLAVTVIENPDAAGSIGQPVAYAGFKNGGAAAIDGQRLFIAAAGKGYIPVQASNERTPLLVVNAESLELEEVRPDALVRGVGLNGPAPVRDGKVLFTGVASDWSGRALNLVTLNDDSVTEIQLPESVAVTDVPGGEFAGRQPTFVQGGALLEGGIFFSIKQPVRNNDGTFVELSRTYYYDTAEDRFDLLDEMAGDYPVPPTPDGKCSGTNRTSIDPDTGDVSSTVTFWGR